MGFEDESEFEKQRIKYERINNIEPIQETHGHATCHHNIGLMTFQGDSQKHQNFEKSIPEFIFPFEEHIDEPCLKKTKSNLQESAPKKSESIKKPFVSTPNFISEISSENKIKGRKRVRRLNSHLDIKKPEKKVIVCKVVYDGVMKPDRPFQFPDIPDIRQAFDLDVITARDVIDIDECINSTPYGADYIALPFVKNA